MFERLKVTGSRGAIMYGSARTAAAVRGWTIFNAAAPGAPRVWTLTATVEQVNPAYCRMALLYFSAPRAGGFWYWQVLAPPVIVGRQLMARLGPPEQ